MNTFVQTEAVTARALDAILPQSDVRTRSILARRRSADLPYRRGWLIRRVLLTADVVGLTLAFVVVDARVRRQHGGRHVSTTRELLLFLAALPVWIVLAKLYGLYERDEERTDHSTIDDVVGVFHLVTVGAWLLYIGGAGRPGFAEPARRARDRLLGRGRRSRSRLPGRSPAARAAGARRVPAEHDHRRRRRRRPADRAQDPQPPRVRHQPRRLRRRGAEGAARRPRASDDARRAGPAAASSSGCSTSSA